MLVLSRKIGESLLIDSKTEVRVLEVRGGRVRLGITAPAELTIRRSELTANSAVETGRLIARSGEVLEVL